MSQLSDGYRGIFVAVFFIGIANSAPIPFQSASGDSSDLDPYNDVVYDRIPFRSTERISPESGEYVYSNGVTEEDELVGSDYTYDYSSSSSQSILDSSTFDTASYESFRIRSFLFGPGDSLIPFF